MQTTVNLINTRCEVNYSRAGGLRGRVHTPVGSVGRWSVHSVHTVHRAKHSAVYKVHFERVSVIIAQYAHANVECCRSANIIQNCAIIFINDTCVLCKNTSVKIERKTSTQSMRIITAR